MQNFTLIFVGIVILFLGIGIGVKYKPGHNNYDEIQQLVINERMTRNQHDYAALADCYWPDATVATSWVKGTISDYLAGNNNRAEASSDEVIIGRESDPNIHIKGNRAWIELPATGQHWIHVNGERAIWTSHMRLIYRIEKRNGKWKIADLTTVFEKDMLAPVIPGTDLHINPKDLVGLRPSYMWMAYVRTAAGGHVSDDLLGTDRPNDITRLYAETRDWVNGAK